MAKQGFIVARVIASHPHLTQGALLGAATALLLWAIPNSIGDPARVLISWNIGAIAFVVLLMWAKRGVTPDDMAKHAREQDEGRHTILWLCVLAAGFSVFAIWQELGAAQRSGGRDQPWQIALAFSTVAISWLFTHVAFASHYAHEYYGQGAGGRPAKGLKFPGGGDPDFWDILHFALVIGVANQTADVAIESRAARRTATLHGIVAFLFNTVVLAMSINFAASIFS